MDKKEKPCCKNCKYATPENICFKREGDGQGILILEDDVCYKYKRKKNK